MKKIFRLTLLAALLAAAITGCQNNNQSAESTDQSASQTDQDNPAGDTSLTDVTEKGTFILGLDDSFPPMGFRDEDQNIIGFDIDVATEICSRMGVELVLQPINWDAKEQELSTKNIDCIWNGFTANAEREKAMTLSKPYLTNTQVVVVSGSSDLATLDDLAGKTVVIQNGSTAAEAIDNEPEFKASIGELVGVKDNVKALMDLEIGGSDAVVMDEVVARYYIAQDAEKFKVFEEKLADEQYVIGFRKGEEALCAEIEKHLDDMKADGTLKTLSEKWLGEDLTITE